MIVLEGPTGIPGFVEITEGGLPRGSTRTLVGNLARPDVLRQALSLAEPNP